MMTLAFHGRIRWPCVSFINKNHVQKYVRSLSSSSGTVSREDSTVQPWVPPVDYVSRAEIPSGVPGINTGRQGDSGKTIAVFGATGFIGEYVVAELALRGHNIIVTTRGDDMSWRRLKTCADYGKLAPSYISVKDEKSVRDTIKGCDVVVNLMGKYYETKHYLPIIINCSYEDVHITAAEMVARVAREENVKHLVHVSCAYAKPDSASRWAKTKAEGEKRVTKQFPGAVIVRPNICYGSEDRFLNNIGFFAEWLPYLPLIAGGSSKLRPVFVGDVGIATAVIASSYNTAGETFNLSGDSEYTWKQVYEYVVEQTQGHATLMDLPLNAALFGARAVNNLPKPWLSPEEILAWQEDATGPSDSEKSFPDLNLKPSNFETKAHDFLFRFIPGGHFMNKDSSRTSSSHS